jgi:hypothetical protein
MYCGLQFQFRRVIIIREIPCISNVKFATIIIVEDNINK